MSTCGKAYLGWKQSNQVVWALGCYTEGIKAQAGRFPTILQRGTYPSWAFYFLSDDQNGGIIDECTSRNCDGQ